MLTHTNDYDSLTVTQEMMYNMMDYDYLCTTNVSFKYNIFINIVSEIIMGGHNSAQPTLVLRIAPYCLRLWFLENGGAKIGYQ